MSMRDGNTDGLSALRWRSAVLDMEIPSLSIEDTALFAVPTKHGGADAKCYDPFNRVTEDKAKRIKGAFIQIRLYRIAF